MEADSLPLLVAQLNEIARTCTVLVRRHPNAKYANRFEHYRAQLAAEVSDALTENINSFIDRSSVVAGYMSAALIQAVLRGRDVVYLADQYLRSLRSYHDYYRRVTMVDMAELADHVSRHFSLGREPE